MNVQTVIIAAGGTGGHLYPGIALARELRARGFDPAFIVRSNDAGIEIIQREGFHFHQISVTGMPRTLSFRFIPFIYRQVSALLLVSSLYSMVKPVAVIGMGGYISFSAVLVARVKGIYTLIHEQNFVPGLANRVLAHIAHRVAVSFEQSLNRFPHAKTIVTGNPVRAE